MAFTLPPPHEVTIVKTQPRTCAVCGAAIPIGAEVGYTRKPPRQRLDAVCKPCFPSAGISQPPAT